MTPAPDPPPPGETPPREDNVLKPAKARRGREAMAEPSPAPVLNKDALPAAIARRYHAEPALFGRHIDYYEGGGAKRPAFRDRGDRLAAFQGDPATVAALLTIAQHRGWSRIEARGDDVFRREVWMQAQYLGLEVRGYKPKARDRDEAAKIQALAARRVRHAGPRKTRAGEAGPELAERFRRASSAEARRDPDLAAAQARLSVVDAVARGVLRDPEDQARVKAAAKARIADHLAEGRSFAAPKIVEAQRASRTRDATDVPGPGLEQERRPGRGPERVRGR